MQTNRQNLQCHPVEGTFERSRLHIRVIKEDDGVRLDVGELEKVKTKLATDTVEKTMTNGLIK